MSDTVTVPTEDLLARVADPAVRRQLVELRDLLQFHSKVLGVKEFRDDMKAVRERTADGRIVVVADRGEVDDPRDAMVVLTLETLQTTLMEVLRVAAAARKRGALADLLVGLTPVPAGARDFELDFDRLAHDEAANPDTIEI